MGHRKGLVIKRLQCYAVAPATFFLFVCFVRTHMFPGWTSLFFESVLPLPVPVEAFWSTQPVSLSSRNVNMQLFSTALCFVHFSRSCAMPQRTQEVHTVMQSGLNLCLFQGSKPGFGEKKFPVLVLPYRHSTCYLVYTKEARDVFALKTERS